MTKIVVQISRFVPDDSPYDGLIEDLEHLGWENIEIVEEDECEDSYA